MYDDPLVKFNEERVSQLSLTGFPGASGGSACFVVNLVRMNFTIHVVQRNHCLHFHNHVVYAMQLNPHRSETLHTNLS